MTGGARARVAALGPLAIPFFATGGGNPAPMKRFLILSVLLLALGGGGAAWWFLMREPPSEGDQTAQLPEIADLISVDVDPLTVPVIRDGRVVQHMSFVVVLRVNDEEELRLVYKAMRHLKDAYIKELHVLLARRYVWEHEDIGPYVKKRLMVASERVVGPGVVEEVLLRGISSRQPRPT